MRLSAHLIGPHGIDIEDGTISGEEGVEKEAEVGLGDLFGEIGQVESVGKHGFLFSCVAIRARKSDMGLFAAAEGEREREKEEEEEEEVCIQMEQA